MRSLDRLDTSCRFCNHKESSHDIGKFGAYCQGCSGWMSSTYSTYKHEFVPSDNLEYLEWCLEKKSEVKI